MPKRVAMYLRVSTASQTTENQRQALQAVADQRGWQVVQTFEDAGISGSKGRDQRPGLDALHRAMTRGEFDLVLAWSIDRLGRSLQDLVGILNEMRSVGCDLYLHQQAVDTTTPAGKAMLQMCGVFAEFERSMIVDRVNAGLARARAQGKRLGRPKISEEIEDGIRTTLKRRDRPGLQKIAAEHGVGVGTVQRILQALPMATRVYGE
jgi:DNA invertase Pin-like site-specific DNA recombinase